MKRRLKIQNGEDRDHVVVALANAGYEVKIIVERLNFPTLSSDDYFVEYEEDIKNEV